MLDNSEGFNLAARGQWSTRIQTDYDGILSGQISETASEWSLEQLRKWGHTVDGIRAMRKTDRMKICDKLVRAARRYRVAAESQILDSILESSRVTSMNTGFEERTLLHHSLQEWAAGPLKLEHPQSSSYHHLMEYDERIGGNFFRRQDTEHPQLFVVERDWARAFAGYELTGDECPMPFPFCCFEFRISGVRVLAMYWDDDKMMCVYGRGGVWVCDDYAYDIRSGRPTKLDLTTHDTYEFPRVVRLVMDNVRVACIMIDAQVAERTTVRASQRLVERRVSEKKSPPRDHYVVDLKRRHRPPGHRDGGGGLGALRAPQRGHFRRGTWVHYDDPESGKTQYADAGGFWHSRTWRSWHFAGDPNNIIEKEYRL